MKPTFILIDDPVPEPERTAAPEARERMTTWWSEVGSELVQDVNRRNLR
ncbi:hypothetical protein EDD29_0094 [Actinocorallia herbida]|uniref:Uncharacterized protein n=1 Tax=Actinocorallia herbida TaxID=58109 RepID=A0A3N1CMT9_9ACTN|nr:hypothetical protein [Actinocorallia herbida]ROO82613.1 hypothetical protein EDD29_0094 [Actinocorallia herbida]